jgi:hypothetical protein
MRHRVWVLVAGIVISGLVVKSPFGSVVLAQSETFSATATVKTVGGVEATAPVVVVVTRPTTEAERATVVDALKKGGTAGVVQAIKTMPDAGYIEVGGTKTTLKYAYIRPSSGGRLVTVVAPAPIVKLGAGLPNAQSKAGFDLALAVLEVKDAGAGSGELAPAAKVKLNDAGALQTEDYGSAAVMLSNVRVKK